MKCDDKMVRGGVAGVLDNEIVNDKREHYGQAGVCQRNSVRGTGEYPCLVRYKVRWSLAIIMACLRPGMPFSDIEVDPDVRGKCKKGVLCDDIVQDGVDGQRHVLVAAHGCNIIENFNV